MEDIKTELGKIYCKYNEEKDEFDKFRVYKLDKDDDGNISYHILRLNNDYHIDEDDMEIYSYNKEEYKEFVNDHVLLKSEGIISITNVISYKDDTYTLKDVILIFFPNNKMTKVPSIKEPYVIARQGVDNIFAQMSGLYDVAGISISLDTLPAGYTLSDFLISQEAISSKLCHVYKTDRAEELNMLLGSKTTDEILEDMYQHRITYLSNTMENYEEYVKKANGCVDGYCNTLYKFMIESGFIEDIMLKMGVRIIDFKLEENMPLGQEDKILLSALYGGISICKAVPLKFDYEINMDVVKMPYLLLLDSEGLLYIVPYTRSDDEIDEKAVYESMQEQAAKIQERLLKCVKAYDIHKNDESTLKF